MERCLGLLPGSVSPLGLIHDPETKDHTKEHFPNGHRVKLFLDQDLKTAERISFHPCDNTATVVLTLDDFKKYLTSIGKKVIVVD
jgi:Ala-tRNA(Pro) deacylase